MRLSLLTNARSNKVLKPETQQLRGRITVASKATIRLWAEHKSKQFKHYGNLITKQEFTVLESPQQSEVAEGFHGAVVELLRCLLIQDLTVTARTNQCKSPFELFYQKISTNHYLGCLAYVIKRKINLKEVGFVICKSTFRGYI